MGFEFATAGRIIFGEGSFEKIGGIAADLGKVALVASGLPPASTERLTKLLSDHRVTFIMFNVDSEPTVDLVRRGCELAREAGCDLVIGFGGGSAIDTGKAIAVLLTNQGDVQEYLEVIGGGKALKEKPVPVIAIPTTAGTGAEVTRNAVLESPEHQVKVSLRSQMMYPRIALVDPELTYSLPPEITAHTGLDALTQLIEPYVSVDANPITDSLCREGLSRISWSLLRAYIQGDDEIARKNMSLASLFGGLALANAKLGAVHGFAGPIGGRYHAPHGAVCARLLPAVVITNIRALDERNPESPALNRYLEIFRILTGRPGATFEQGINWIDELCEMLHVPALSRFGMIRDDFPDIIQKASEASSMKGNPIKLTVKELNNILSRTV